MVVPYDHTRNITSHYAVALSYVTGSRPYQKYFRPERTCGANQGGKLRLHAWHATLMSWKPQALAHSRLEAVTEGQL